MFMVSIHTLVSLSVYILATWHLHHLPYNVLISVPLHICAFYHMTWQIHKPIKFIVHDTVLIQISSDLYRYTHPIVGAILSW